MIHQVRGSKEKNRTRGGIVVDLPVVSGRRVGVAAVDSRSQLGAGVDDFRMWPAKNSQRAWIGLASEASDSLMVITCLAFAYTIRSVLDLSSRHVLRPVKAHA
jgi:hypothetical protein